MTQTWSSDLLTFPEGKLNRVVKLYTFLLKMNMEEDIGDD